MPNFVLFFEIIMYLKKQIAKIAHFKKSTKKKKICKKLKIFLIFEELITKIRDEFKQILHTSENQKRM